MTDYKLPCWFALSGANYTNGSVANCPVNDEIMQELSDEFLTVSSFINSDRFKEQRLKLQRGEWPQGCESCRVREQNGTPSHRQGELARFNSSNYDFNTGEIAFAGLKTVELRFSNLCNMACLHCNDTQSSRWESKLKEYIPDELDAHYGLRQLDKSLRSHAIDRTHKLNLTDAEVQQIILDLNTNFPHIERIDFCGGEVLFQPAFYSALELLHQHPNRNNIEIFFHTNFNARFDHKYLADLLKPFGKRTIKISIDSSKNTYSYFRTGDWERLEYNINEYAKWDSSPQTRIGAVITTGIHQVLDIKNTVADIASLGLDSIKVSFVSYPDYLNPSNIKLHFADHFAQQCELTRQQLKHNPDAVQAVNKIQQFVDKTPTNEHAWKGFIEYTRKADQLWNKDFNKHYEHYTLNDQEIVTR